jgi:hypothetical protein
MEVGAIVFGAIGILAFALGANGMVVIPLLVVPVGAMLLMTLAGRA